MSTEFAPELLTWTTQPIPGTPDRAVMFTDLSCADGTLHGVVFHLDGETWATVIGVDENGTETNRALAHGPFSRDDAKDWVRDTLLLLTAP